MIAQPLGLRRWNNQGKAVKKSWRLLASVILLMCLAGCEDGAATAPVRSAGTPTATSTTVTYAPAAPRAPDPTSEFLSAWRPKE
ncbi:hypothetical protein [Variovorax sp. SRS16]|uniref:hypothetical protein n=1 Tax=Variovorax sp. SRS16 TaxID=282217 RepID=UPI001E50C5EB|nr:hypothetical protein [Variovorax sp. SRS16]